MGLLEPQWSTQLQALWVRFCIGETSCMDEEHNVRTERKKFCLYDRSLMGLDSMLETFTEGENTATESAYKENHDFLFWEVICKYFFFRLQIFVYFFIFYIYLFLNESYSSVRLPFLNNYIQSSAYSNTET